MTHAPLLTCHILDTGHCLAHEHILIEGGSRRQVACHSIVALLGHPHHGWLMWDAGYAPHMLAATEHFPYSLYRLVTPLRLRPDLAAAAQLPSLGLTPADVQAVVISHFHADHLAGLHDFPHSRFLALPEAYASVAGTRGLSALRRAFIPSLLPPDFRSRLTLLTGPQAGTPAPPVRQAGTPAGQEQLAFVGPELPGLGRSLDLYGDGSLLLVRLPGHARGQLGLLAQTSEGPIFFVADSCWLTRSIVENRPPSRVGSLIADDPHQVARTIAGLHLFAIARPDVLIVPSHCPETFAKLFYRASGD